MLTLFKVVLSIPIGIGLVYPFIQSDVSDGILGEIKVFGPMGSACAIAVFLVLVFLYALDLIKSLKLVSATSRKAEPRSVWFMFLLPYNFIEDFFIVSSVAKSLKAEATTNPALAAFKSFGMVSGIGWCVAQLISLIPNWVGFISGLLAIGFWTWHWFFIRRVNAILTKFDTN